MVEVNVTFSAMFRDTTGTDSASIEMKGRSVGDLLSELTGRFGEEFEEKVIDEETGDPRRFVNIFVNGSDIRNLEGVGTELDENDVVRMIPAVAGGSSDSSSKGPSPSIKPDVWR